MALQMGAFAPPIRKQVKAPGHKTKQWQRTHDAIVRLYVLGYVSDKQKVAMARRLFKEINDYLSMRAKKGAP